MDTLSEINLMDGWMDYHWLDSVSRVLISTCCAPLVQAGQRK